LIGNESHPEFCISLGNSFKPGSKYINILFMAIYESEFTTYSSGGFSWSDQERTARLLARHPGPVVISNQATPRIVELYESLGFELTYLDGPRRISCTGDRSSAREVLAVKP